MELYRNFRLIASQVQRAGIKS